MELLTSGTASLLIFVAFATAVVLFWAVGGIGRSRTRYPPVAATIFHQFINIRRLHDYQTELSHRYKTFRILAPDHYHIYTVDPEVVEHILKTNFNNYGKGKFIYRNTNELFGDGIFAVDGDKWRQQRKIASYEFSTKNSREFIENVFKINATKLGHIVSKSATSNEIIDIQGLFMKSTMDSIFEIGFGIELKYLEGSTEGNTFIEAFDYSSEYIMKRFINVFWRLQRFLQIGSEAELKKNIKVVDEFVYKLIDIRRGGTSSLTNDSVKQEDILSRLLAEMEKDPEKITRKYLRDIILNFLIAGKDTTAGTLSWFICMLCKHPLVQEKVAREVKESMEAIGNKKHIDEFAKSINDEALDKMQYLHAALSETLRLYPAVPMESKSCFSDDILPNGYNVRKGDIIYHQPYAMGRMKFLWGDDAEVFRPERWINDQGVYCPQSPFKFTAFQAGPRICSGKEFAYKQMKIFASVLLSFFRFKLVDEAKVINYRAMITLHIDQGLHVYALYR